MVVDWCLFYVHGMLLLTDKCVALIVLFARLYLSQFSVRYLLFMLVVALLWYLLIVGLQAVCWFGPC